MGCIEIAMVSGLRPVSPSLIETWDVLKCVSQYKDFCKCEGLIETWDVLK